MLNFSYTKSNVLVTDLGKVEELHKKLLLSPLAPREKLVLRWNAARDQIRYSQLLSTTGNLSTNEEELLRYKRAHDTIYNTWMMNTQAVTADTLTDIYEEIYREKSRTPEQDLENNLRYIQANPDNPVIQSAMAQIIILASEFFAPQTAQLAHLTGLIFLYKYGYDFRRLICMEQYYFENKDQYRNLIMQSLRNPNVTPFLEFVVEATEVELTRLLGRIQSKDFLINLPEAFYELTARQRNILSTLGSPGSRISNREAQKLFKISAITAARDLARLTSLGMLLPIGKGRSTYYTKA